MKEFFKNLFLAAVSLIFSLILLEGCFQLLHFPKTEGRTENWIIPHKLYHHDHNPGSVYIERVEYGRSIKEIRNQFDALGEKDLLSKEALPKILFIGDSFVQANQVNLDEMFGNIVEKELGSVDIVNIGCSSWSSINYYNWIKTNLPRLGGLRSIYLFYFSNDPYDTLTYLQDSDNSQKLDDITFYAFTQREAGEVSSLRNWLYQHTKIYYLASEAKARLSEMMRVRNRSRRKEIDDTEWESLFAGIKTQRQRRAVEADKVFLVKIKEYAKKNHLEFHLVYIPMAQQVAADENATGSQYYAKKFLKTIYSSTVFQDELRQLAVKHAFPFIDLTEGLKSYKRNNPRSLLYLKRDGHFSPIGHQVVADIMVRNIRDAAHEP